jgi:hypothetical protein
MFGLLGQVYDGSIAATLLQGWRNLGVRQAGDGTDHPALLETVSREELASWIQAE